MLMLERVRQKCDDEEFDFLHFHLDYYPFSLFSRQPTPFLTTLHGRLDLPEHQPVFMTFSSVPVISISNAQRRPVPQANWVCTIHHGLPEKLLTPRPVTPGYLAVLALQLRFIWTSESMGHHDSGDHGWREHRSRRRLSFGRVRYEM